MLMEHLSIISLILVQCRFNEFKYWLRELEISIEKLKCCWLMLKHFKTVFLISLCYRCIVSWTHYKYDKDHIFSFPSPLYHFVNMIYPFHIHNQCLLIYFWRPIKKSYSNSNPSLSLSSFQFISKQSKMFFRKESTRYCSVLFIWWGGAVEFCVEFTFEAFGTEWATKKSVISIDRGRVQQSLLLDFFIASYVYFRNYQWHRHCLVLPCYWSNGWQCNELPANYAVLYIVYWHTGKG